MRMLDFITLLRWFKRLVKAIALALHSVKAALAYHSRTSVATIRRTGRAAVRIVTTSIQLSQAACMSSSITKTAYSEDHS